MSASVDALTFADFSDSRRLRAALSGIVNPSQSTRHSSKTASFLQLSVALLHTSVIGRLLCTEAQLKQRLHVLLEFYNKVTVEIDDCIEVILKINEFDLDSTSSMLLSPFTTISSYSTSVLQGIECITMMVINVKVLSSDIQETVRSLLDYPFEKRVLAKYFAWVFNHAKELQRNCQYAELVDSLDRNIRAWIKGEIYESPTHILVTYNTKYKEYLSCIGLPSLSYWNHDINQGLKDVARESVYINNRKVSSTNGSSLSFEPEVRAAILDWYTLASQHSLSALEFENEGESLNEDATIEVEAVPSDAACLSALTQFVYSHLLTASSRTTISGDVFCILVDLYGDDQQLVISSSPNSKHEIHVRFVNKQVITVEMSQVFSMSMKKSIDTPFIYFKTKSISSIYFQDAINVFRSCLAENLEQPIDAVLQRQYILDELLKEEHRLCSRTLSITPTLSIFK